MGLSGLSQSPFLLNLRRLFWLRTIAIGGQLIVMLGAHYGLDLALPLVPMLVVVLLLIALNALTWIRTERKGPVSDFSLRCNCSSTSPR